MGSFSDKAKNFRNRHVNTKQKNSKGSEKDSKFYKLYSMPIKVQDGVGILLLIHLH